MYFLLKWYIIDILKHPFMPVVPMRIISKIIHSKAVNQNLAQDITSWQEHLTKQKGFSLHTVKNYCNDLGHFLSFLRNYFDTQITAGHIEAMKIQDWQQWLLHRHQNQNQLVSTKRAVASIRNFCNFLKSKGCIESHTCDQLPSSKTPKRLPRAIGQSDVFKFLKHIRQQDRSWIGDRNYAICMVIYGCGLRISEALQITREQWNESQGLIIRGKGRKERIVPVLPVVHESVETYLQNCPWSPKASNPIFLGKRGQQIRPEIVQRLIRQTGLQLAVGEKVTSHTLRHCFATHLLEKDVNLRTIQELMGHSSLTTTQQYTKINTAELSAAYQASHPRANKNTIIKGDGNGSKSS